MATGLSAPRRAPARARWPWLLVAGSWAAAVLATALGRRTLIDHRFLLEESGLPWSLAAALFLVGWQVMIAAMMLPISLPAATGALAAASPGAHPRRELAVFLADHAAVWSAFGLLAFVGDTAIHRLVDASPWLAAHTFLIGATTFASAGLFQFSRWKVACLAACRDPHALVAAGAQPSRPAERFGVRYGCASVGCCWALMLITFGVGAGGLGWMAGLTAAMLGETAAPDGRRVRRAIGIALLLLAALWLAHPGGLVPAGAA